MGQADWAECTDILQAADLRRGATAFFTPPPGSADNQTFGYNSTKAVTGAHGMTVNLPNFNPTGTGSSNADGGGSVRGCVRRGPSAGNEGIAPFLFFCCVGDSVNDNGYMVGLSDADPYNIVLAKGPLLGGPKGDAIIATSSAQFNSSNDLWHHLKMDPIVEPNGDVLIRVYSNDLSLHPLGTPPNWQPVAGVDQFLDDAVHAATGSAPLWGGYCGFGAAIYDALNRRAAFKAIQAGRID